MANIPFVSLVEFTMKAAQGLGAAAAQVDVSCLYYGRTGRCRERDTSLESVENVIKQECRARAENVKLAQVGFVYDVAHEKAEAYIGEVSRLDQKKDRERASKCRREERRRKWEERHIKRIVATKQKQNDNQKKRAFRNPRGVTGSTSHAEGLTQTSSGALTKNPNADMGGTEGCTLPGDAKRSLYRVIRRTWKSPGFQTWRPHVDDNVLQGR